MSSDNSQSTYSKDLSNADSTNDQQNEPSTSTSSESLKTLPDKNLVKEFGESSAIGESKAQSFDISTNSVNMNENNPAPSANQPKEITMQNSFGKTTDSANISVQSSDQSGSTQSTGHPVSRQQGGGSGGGSSSIKFLLHGADVKQPSSGHVSGQTQLPSISLHPPCPPGQSSTLAPSSVAAGPGAVEAGSVQQPTGLSAPPTVGIRPLYQMPPAPAPVPNQPGGNIPSIVGGRKPSVPYGYPVPQQQQPGLPGASIDPRTFMALAREELVDSPRIMTEFLATMKDFKEEVLGMNEVIGRITRLFRGRQRLLEAFNSYLPENCKLDVDAIMRRQESMAMRSEEGQIGSAQDMHFPRQMPSSASGTELPPILGPGQPWNVPLAGPPNAFPSIQSLNLPQSGGPPAMQPSHYHAGMMNASQQQQQQQQKQIMHQQSSRGPQSTPTGPPMGGYSQGGPVGARVGPQMHPSGQQQAGMGAQSSQLPPMMVSHSVQAQPPAQPHHPQPISSASQSTNSALSRVKNEELEPAVRFIQKIYNRFLQEPEVFKTFLDVVDDFPNQRKPLSELYLQINTLFAGHPDLIDDFNKFLPEHFGAFAAQGGQQTLYQAGTSISGQQKYPPYQSQRDQYEAGRKQAIPAGKSAQYPAQKIPPTSYQKVPSSVYKEQPPLKKQKQPYPDIDEYSQKSEQLELFESIKKFLNSKQLYAEFTRCLNLFNQDLVGIKDLLQIANNYLSRSPELFNRFKEFIDYNDSIDMSAAGIQEGKQKEKQSESIPQVDVASCKKYGSYRILPKMYQTVSCSGRTELAKEVLNDLLVGCPQFASEEGSFIASKKNQFEEVLFKCEDDRFELDMLIDANRDTIHVLEALDRKIQSMSLQERSTFKLGPNLGIGTSTVIYKKAISKIYGERVNEIMEGLYSNPVTAVSVILNRLLAKDEEWKRIQRESQKIWRDIHTKNYYKALDHQSISFKSTDKKAINTKSFLAEIEMIARESKNPRSHHQILTINQYGLLKDLIKVACIYVKKGLSLHSHEKNRLCSFFNSFFPTIFGFATIPTMSGNAGEKNGDEMEYQISIDNTSDKENGTEKGLTDSLGKQNETNAHSIFYSNGQIYALLKTFEIGYTRLALFKNASSTLSPSLVSSLSSSSQNKVAIALELQKPLLELEETSNIYGALVKMLSKFVTGHLDSNYFEEKARFLFGSNAFQLFTFDKLISSLVRQAQIILADPVCDNLLRLFDTVKTKSKKSFTEYSIKLATESLINQDNEPVYRIELVKSGVVGVKMLDKRHTLLDPSSSFLGRAESIEERWSRYIDKFVSEDNYELIKSRKPPLLMKRTLRKIGFQEYGSCPSVPWPHVYIRYELECKICINTYKMFFVEDSEDFVLNTKNWQKPTTKKKRKLSLHRTLDEVFSK